MKTKTALPMFPTLTRYDRLHRSIRFVGHRANQDTLRHEAQQGSQQASDILKLHYAISGGDWKESTIDRYNDLVSAYLDEQDTEPLVIDHA